jgi:hypothetical protein
MDWTTISALATAVGTLTLAAVTVGSIRSANRAARAAELSLLAAQRPLLIGSRLEDAPTKVGFNDSHWLLVPGGQGVAEVGERAVYLAISLRNVGTGIAVLDGWRLCRRDDVQGSSSTPDVSGFVRLTRDLYIPVGDIGFWQGTFRDPSSVAFADAKEAIEERVPLVVDVLYSDFEGGQRMVSRFALSPRPDGGWIAAVGQHWNLDRPDPRHSNGS